jgi:hypothetical protein
MSRDVGRRFCVWEPYWRIDRVIHIGLTSPVDSRSWKIRLPGDPPKTPRTVASFSVADLDQVVFDKVKNWGESIFATPKEGDYQLSFRMLPVKVDPKKKHYRADCHLWPMGTFLQVNGKPIHISQRKQQQHNPNLWKGMSYPLEMASLLSNPKCTNQIDIGCYDNEQYIFCLAVCQYQTPATLTKQSLSMDNQHFQRLSMEESIQKAMQLINQQMIVVDGDDDGGTADLGKFVFSLTCPISKLPMTTPVRGRNCKHWQVSVGGYFVLPCL